MIKQLNQVETSEMIHHTRKSWRLNREINDPCKSQRLAVRRRIEELQDDLRLKHDFEDIAA